MSSWDDIIIGTPEPGMNRYTSATLCAISGEPADGINGYQSHGISRGRDHYWLSDMILDCGATIYRGAPEFDILDSMIAEGKTLAVIMNYLDKVILNHLTPARLRKEIIRSKADSFEEGKLAAKRELREWLGNR